MNHIRQTTLALLFLCSTGSIIAKSKLTVQNNIQDEDIIVSYKQDKKGRPNKTVDKGSKTEFSDADLSSPVTFRIGKDSFTMTPNDKDTYIIIWKKDGKIGGSSSDKKVKISYQDKPVTVKSDGSF
jgi:hypothetical protein